MPQPDQKPTSKKILITKASGENQPFSEDKLRRSLRRTKASAEAVSEVIRVVEAKLREGMTTREIYDLAYATLRSRRRLHASRYALKRAIIDMGPSGHPFELYVAELMKTKGYVTHVNQTIPGLCVTHEVDIVAEKDDKRLMVECKFHNQSGIKSDVKVSLYVHARFEDIQKKIGSTQDPDKKFHQAWLVTNTELTSDAIRYAECAGMKAIGWNYPSTESLGAWVESSKLHPITCLTTLSQSQKSRLIGGGIILCQDIHEDTKLLGELGLTKEEQADLLSEVKDLRQ